MENIVENQRRHDIAFHADGTIDITAGVAKRLGLRRGDVIGVGIQDGEYILYVRAKAGHYGIYQGRCFATNGGSTRSLRAHSVQISRGVISACGRTGSDTVRLYAGETVTGDCGTGVYLITKNPAG